MKKYIVFLLLCAACAVRAGGDPQNSSMELGPDNRYLALNVDVKFRDHNSVKATLKRAYSLQGHRLHSDDDRETVTLETQHGDYQATIAITEPLKLIGIFEQSNQVNAATINVQYTVSEIPLLSFLLTPKLLASNTIEFPIGVKQSASEKIKLAGHSFTLTITALLQQIQLKSRKNS